MQISWNYSDAAKNGKLMQNLRGSIKIDNEDLINYWLSGILNYDAITTRRTLRGRKCIWLRRDSGSPLLRLLNYWKLAKLDVTVTRLALTCCVQCLDIIMHTYTKLCGSVDRKTSFRIETQGYKVMLLQEDYFNDVHIGFGGSINNMSVPEFMNKFCFLLNLKPQPNYP